MTPPEQSRTLLAMARDDLVALEALAGLDQVADHVVGFHAQQAVEKAIKAVLSVRGIRFPYTHDLTRLVEILEKQDLDTPPQLHEAKTLTPFAVELRYDELPPEMIRDAPLDRPSVVRIVRDLIAWAANEVT